ARDRRLDGELDDLLLRDAVPARDLPALRRAAVAAHARGEEPEPAGRAAAPGPRGPAAGRGASAAACLSAPLRPPSATEPAPCRGRRRRAAGAWRRAPARTRFPGRRSGPSAPAARARRTGTRGRSR